jgi:hypothetical protein
MRDGDDIRKLKNPLGLVISYIHASLFETYDEYDKEAITKQRYHRTFSTFAVFFGTLSILLAILQVFLKAYGDPGSSGDIPGLALFEKGAFFTAIITIAIALGSRLLKGWLNKRYLAEQCRTLKFRALIHPYLSFSTGNAWEKRFTKWKAKFDGAVLSLKKKEDLGLDEILGSDQVNVPPHEASGVPLNIPYLVMLADYYHKKRIATQLEYFSARARSFRTVNRYTERIPQLCFIGSVTFAGLQFGIEFFHLLSFLPDPSVERVQAAIILVILVLPSLGVAFRTWRSSIEVARNASLSGAKYIALRQFEVRLSEERAKADVNWEEVLKIMWECENFLESENKEWLRIMHDAEWFL